MKLSLNPSYQSTIQKGKEKEPNIFLALAIILAVGFTIAYAPGHFMQQVRSELFGKQWYFLVANSLLIFSITFIFCHAFRQQFSFISSLPQYAPLFLMMNLPQITPVKESIKGEQQMLFCSIMGSPKPFSTFENEDIEALDSLPAKLAALSMGFRNQKDSPLIYERGKPGIFYQDISEMCIDTPFIHDTTKREMIAKAFAESATNFANPTQTLEKIRKGELVILPASWHEHVIPLIFYKGHYYVCNRGEGAVDDGSKRKDSAVSFPIDPAKMTVEHLKKIQKQANVPFESARPFFYEQLPTSLMPNDQIQEMQKTVSNSKQRSYNCMYASTNQSLHLVIRLVMSETMGHANEQVLTIKESTLLAKKMTLIQRFNYFENYLVRLSKRGNYYDSYLIETWLTKMEKQLNKLLADLSPNDQNHFLSQLSENYPLTMKHFSPTE